jgi:hypothetical protein
MSSIEHGDSIINSKNFKDHTHLNHTANMSTVEHVNSTSGNSSLQNISNQFNNSQIFLSASKKNSVPPKAQ